MARVTDDRELRRLHDAGAGFIYTDFAGRGAYASSYNVLHEAGCRWVARSNTRVPKHFFASRSEALRWLGMERGAEGQWWRWCADCGAGGRAR